jgi:hypothetical protein
MASNDLNGTVRTRDFTLGGLDGLVASGVDTSCKGTCAVLSIVDWLITGVFVAGGGDGGGGVVTTSSPLLGFRCLQLTYFRFPLFVKMYVPPLHPLYISFFLTTKGLIYV